MRKTCEVVIPEDGLPPDDPKKNRDAGKRYMIREMPSSRSEKWGVRALLALQKAGVQLDVDPTSGMAGLATHGAGAMLTLQFSEVEPLMDEMMGCITICPDPKVPTFERALREEDVEEVLTRMQLRMKVMELHLGFSMADFLHRRAALTTERQ